MVLAPDLPPVRMDAAAPIVRMRPAIAAQPIASARDGNRKASGREFGSDLAASHRSSREQKGPVSPPGLSAFCAGFWTDPASLLRSFAAVI
jgi:hypothetical protein